MRNKKTNFSGYIPEQNTSRHMSIRNISYLKKSLYKLQKHEIF